ncbi:MAG: phosphate ABC transporter substrate-binding protein PstS [Cyanobacteria bacterium RI_101]|nr:phosphate ABC transporter substrate-binding protein PstS [Cyanobacteria bacterium RI_101]
MAPVTLVSRRLSLAAALLTLGAAVGLGGCQSVFSSAPISAEPVVLRGAGATFPAPLYQRWLEEFGRQKAYENVTLTYDAVGSGQGVSRYLEASVDFGASDAPLGEKDRQRYPQERGTLIQIPMTGGLVVFSYNLPGLEGSQTLRLSRQSYCGIVTGEISNWNDPRIAADNPGVSFPDLPLLWVYRSDGSGTTYIFTNHLREACPDWKGGVGKSADWPAGIGADGNQGVSAEIRQSSGAIGYVELAAARKNRLPAAILENRQGEFISPTPEAAAEALVGVETPEDFALTVPDPTAPKAYPIVGLTWLLLYGEYDQPVKKTILNNFVRWALTEGKPYAVEMGYLPLAPDLREKVLTALAAP